MPRYIEVKKAIKAIDELPNCYNGYSDTYDKACIIGTLEEVPTADVVEVVRSKDCKYKQGTACDYSAVWVRPNGSCQWGERRDDAEEID